MKGTASQPTHTNAHCIRKRSAQRHRREGISDGSRRGETTQATRCAARTARPGIAGGGTVLIRCWTGLPGDALMTRACSPAYCVGGSLPSLGELKIADGDAPSI